LLVVCGLFMVCHIKKRDISLLIAQSPQPTAHYF
jgi:hypothetical protein